MTGLLLLPLLTEKNNSIENTDIILAYVTSGLPTLTNSCSLDQLYNYPEVLRCILKRPHVMKHTGQKWKESATQPLVVQLTIYFLTNSLITDLNHLHDYPQWFEQRYLSARMCTRRQHARHGKFLCCMIGTHWSVGNDLWLGPRIS